MLLQKLLRLLMIWMMMISCLCLVGCAQKIQDCIIVTKIPKINNPRYLVKHEPHLARWLAIVKLTNS